MGPPGAKLIASFLGVGLIPLVVLFRGKDN